MFLKTRLFLYVRSLSTEILNPYRILVTDLFTTWFLFLGFCNKASKVNNKSIDYLEIADFDSKLMI